jgi:alkylresorcinol/alkylpyrone synthase
MFSPPATAAVPRLVALSSVTPGNPMPQAEVEARAAAIFEPAGADFARLRPIYANAGIEMRQSVMPLSWYGTPAGWKQRNDLYLEHALVLIEEAAAACLARARLPAGTIDAIVAVSSTGLATPSLDARLMDRLPFRRNVERLPVFGLGCAGGALGLARAAAMARARPGSRVLLVIVELCGLTFRVGDLSDGNLVATALFGDGAAAAIVSTHPADGGIAIRDWGEHTWPDSLDVMGWKVEDDGLGVLFAREIPAIIRNDYPAALDAFLARCGLERDALAALALHPGGAKVMRAWEALFGARMPGLADAGEVLRRHGNMSAPTVLFVLERVLARAGEGLTLVSALGPGFTAAFLLLDVSGQGAAPG